MRCARVRQAFAGCAFVTLYTDGGHATAGASNQVTGNLIFLAQILSLAGFFVAEKPLLARWTPLATLAYSCAQHATAPSHTGAGRAQNHVCLRIACRH